jgi:hypothetical protein
MNILSLVSQNLDNFYQIQTKCYRNSDTVFSPLFCELNEGVTEQDALHLRTGYCPWQCGQINRGWVRIAPKN